MHAFSVFAGFWIFPRTSLVPFHHRWGCYRSSCTWLCVHVCMFAVIYACKYVSLCAYVLACMQALMCACACRHLCVLVHVSVLCVEFIRMCLYICAYASMHKSVCVHLCKCMQYLCISLGILVTYLCCSLIHRDEYAGAHAPAWIGLL